MSYKIKEVKKLPDNEAEISGEIPLDFLLACREEAIKHLKKHLNLPGFREGQIPESVIIKTAGEMGVLEETSEIALSREYPNIIIESKLRPMMQPHVSITRLAPNIPLEFKILLVLEPEFELPDYKKVASEIVETDEQKKRILMMEKITEATKLELPPKFVEHEANHLMHHFRNDLEKAGIQLPAYLEQIKKTEEEMKEEWKKDIVARAKSEMVFGKIAEKENLKTYKEVFEMLEGKKEETISK